MMVVSCSCGIFPARIYEGFRSFIREVPHPNTQLEHFSNACPIRYFIAMQHTTSSSFELKTASPAAS
jgi:hypothetical protein